jgi:exopolyphosphatase/guanosine-5'-triphosphate,3'-diphosphate pyrophosphatase
MRIAAIDIGTNSIHMVIARAVGHSFEIVDRERETVQVGRDSFASGRLRGAAIRRTVDALARFVKLARRHQVDRILCTATAAVREAKNGGELLRAARDTAGVTPRVIPTEEEGRLIYLGVKSALQLEAEPSLIVDIGGGSVQLVMGSHEKLIRVVSAPLGALRLSEILPLSDPAARREIVRLGRHIRRVAREPLAAVRELKPVRVYGSSGSIHAAAQVAHWIETGQTLDQINGHVVTRAALARVARRLHRMTLEEREHLPGVDGPRAEIIIPGVQVLLHVLESVGADRLTLSDYGVREGLVTDYISWHADEISTLDKIEDLRLRSVLGLLAKFQADGRHPRHVARLSLELFDGLQAAHRLGPEHRELLEFAALLHDLGSVIGFDGHTEHSSYIIRNGGLRGFSTTEVAMMACIARYHGKARPRKRDPIFRRLGEPERRAVTWMAAMLRIAEGLDRSHYQLIRSLRVVRGRGRVSVLLTARREAQLEVWASQRRTGLLERLLGVAARVALAPAPAALKPAAAPRRRRPVRPRRAGSRAARATRPRANPPTIVLPVRATGATGARDRRAESSDRGSRPSRPGAPAKPPARPGRANGSLGPASRRNTGTS